MRLQLLWLRFRLQIYMAPQHCQNFSIKNVSSHLKIPSSTDDQDHVEQLVVHVDHELGAVAHSILLEEGMQNVLRMGYAQLCRNLFSRVAWLEVVNLATHPRHLPVQIGYAVEHQTPS
jgi:hypothetical protein